MILEKYVNGHGWHIVGVEDYDDAEVAIAWAREVVLTRRVAAGSFRLVTMQGTNGAGCRQVVMAFDVGHEGEVFR